jgi:hypothetical protein
LVVAGLKQGGCVVRIVRWIYVCCAVLLCSGCAIWENETTNRGGYLDHLLDDHWIKADSQRMRALRAFAIQVSLARIASISSKNDSDRQLMAIRLGATTKRALPVLACALDKNPLGGRNPCFYYDSAMVDYSTALFDLAMVALPIEDAKKLITAATGSLVNPINLIEVTQALVAIGRDALKYGRVVGALYRDTVELDVQVWLATPPIDTRPPPHRVTAAHVAALADIYVSRRDDLPAWLSATAALRAQGLEPWPDPRFFNQLAGLMRYLCGLITTNAQALEHCRAGLPESDLQTVSVLQPLSSSRMSALIRPSGGVGGSPRQNPSQSEDNKKPVLTCPPTSEGQFDSADENLKKLQAYLTSGPGDVAERRKNLQDLLVSASVRQKLIPSRPPELGKVLTVIECREVRQLMATQAKEKRFID